MNLTKKQFILLCLFALFIFWRLFSEYGLDSIAVLLFFFLVICCVALPVFYGKYVLVFLSNNIRKILKKVINIFMGNTPPPKSKEAENKEIISIYHQIKRAVPDYNEPNYELAKKVFLDFNDFNLRNNENGLTIYLGFIPKSLLPYPKNYIKCAYYIFLEKLKKENNLKMFKNVQEIGVSLFLEYPDYEKYKENLTGKNTNGNGKKWIDDALKDMSPNPRETFKKLYGVYEVSEEDYNSSPSSIDSTDEKLIHDFGVLPEIEKDVDMAKIMKNAKNK